jgi:hypothetical protein
MNVCQVNEIVIVAPLSNKVRSAIDTNYVHGKITLKPVFNFDVTTVKSILKAIFYIPANMFKIFKAMRQADHIHLRCPGNTGLLGCVLQIFPSKRKQPNMLEIGIQSKNNLGLQTQKKILQNF